MKTIREYAAENGFEIIGKLNQYRGKGMQYHHDQDAYAQGQRDGRSAMDRRSLQQG